MTAAPARPRAPQCDIDLSLFPPTTARGGSRVLEIGGCSLAGLAARYGTPALVVDESGLRDRARLFQRAFSERHANSQVHFATKAFPSAAILRLLAAEGLNLDVASGNELAIAMAGGVTPSRCLLHGNAKTETELAFALQQGIGHIVVDNAHDVRRIARLSDTVQPVLLRVVPGIAAKTHEANATGHSGSKFGVPIDHAAEFIELIRREPNLRLDGLHAHIGSQIFDLDQFRDEVAALARLERFPVYNFGGGLAARYVSDDPPVRVEAYADALVDAAHRFLGSDVRLLVEPGRSLVASTMVTLYTVVTVKSDVRTHVAVDGGMGDNLEVSLYGQRFQPWLIDRDGPLHVCDLVGHHCESGDVLARNTIMPVARPGDVVVVPATGAYTYTMSNNYNAACRPPILLCRDGSATVAVRRETLDDLLAREMLLTERMARCEP